MKFLDKAHQTFYEQAVTLEVAENDPYRKALFYVLGLNHDVREHIGDLYDFVHHIIREGGLRKGWQTSGSLQTCRLAFNLYNCFAGKDSLEALEYTPYYLFDCGRLAPYYWTAIGLRFPANEE